MLGVPRDMGCDMTKYVLEVYEPDDWGMVAFSIESETPFGAISKGDFLHHLELITNHRLQVVAVEHLFYGYPERPTQKTCVHTKLIERWTPPSS